MTQTMKGIDVKITSRRLYKDPLIYSHLLGFVSSLTPEQYDVLYDTYLINDVIGKTGLEKEYEDTLRGLLGKKSVEVNAFGKEANIISIKEPKNGDDIYLTIDSKIQEKLYEYVQKHIDRLNKGRGAAVVLDPSTGEILALVSYPGYNNQTFYQGINTTEYRELLNDVNKPLFNRAVDGQYPPGSTFKLVVATAGLEDKIITPTTNIYSSGGIKVSRWFFPDWKFGGHGYTNLYKAISESVNTYFYILGGGFEERVGLGVSRINEQARKFGLGGKTGVDFPNESPGFLPTPDWKKEQKNERWYIGDTYNLSIGQGDLLVTPLQMANVIATVSNGGTLYEPHFLKSKYKNNNSVDQSSWVIDNQVISKKIMEEIRKATRETVLTGSGIRLLSAPITSAGKTGTAEWSNKKDPHGWYIGFAPYQDPEIAFAFIVEEGIGGNTSAVPIADDFLNWYGSEYKTNDDL
jgi:penicillin-binding protein 2